MKKNRTIPFGYCMINGEIQAESRESKAVQNIFTAYLNGSSLVAIAEMMSNSDIPYNAVSKVWNKNMIKRILENEKYLGKGEYPALIDEIILQKANAKKQIKANLKSEISEELQAIRNLTYCTEYGHRLSRIGGNGRGAKWDCRNADCSRFGYRLSDQMLIGAILNILNTAISNIDMLYTNSELCIYSPSLEVTRQHNEISRLMENLSVDFDNAKDEIFKLAQVKYDCCEYSDKPQKTQVLKSLLVGKEELNTIDIGLLNSVVSQIRVSHFHIVEVEFINSVVIKNTTERIECNDSNSTECNGNSCEISAG